MAEDTYPEELYIDEVDVYDYSDIAWEELQELLEWEAREYDTELDELMAPDFEPEQPESEHDEWFWGRDDDRE